jgi:hypothetical protein
MNIRFAVLATAVSSVFAIGVAQAQQPAAIERVKLTDGQLSCAQMNGEVGDMDKAIKESQAAIESGNNTSMAGTAGNVAAEVAGRTGLFGQIGGIAGALFGQTAAQTAAGAAKQSGQQTVAQANDRIKQATARKEHISALFVARGCNPSDLNYEPPVTEKTAAAVQTAMAAATPAAPKPVDPVELQKLFAPMQTVTALPDIDPDAHFKGRMGGTFGKDMKDVLPNGRRVAIAGFRVAFITENTVSAQVRSSYFLGRDTSGASSTLNLKLTGVDAATMQAITDKAYADFVKQLQFAGREVVPQEELKEFVSGLELSGTPGKPYTDSKNGQSVTILTPTGTPLWFHNWDGQWSDKGAFAQTNIRRISEYSAKHKAIFIAPFIVVNFARMSSSGNQSGLVARSAEVGAELNMQVVSLTSTWTRADESRGGLTMGGDEGSLSMAAPIGSKKEFGTMREVSADNNSAVKGAFDALGKTMGMLNAGGAARSKSEQVAETSGPAYAAAAVDALGTTTGTFAKWFQKYPAK